MGGGGGQKVDNDPWKGQQPYLTDVMSDAQDLHDWYRNNQQHMKYPQGPYVAPMNPTQIMAGIGTQYQALNPQQSQATFENYVNTAMGAQNVNPIWANTQAFQGTAGIGQGQNTLNQIAQGSGADYAAQAGVGSDVDLAAAAQFAGGAVGPYAQTLQGMTGYGGLGEAQNAYGGPVPGALPATNQYVMNTLGQQTPDYYGTLGQIASTGIGAPIDPGQLNTGWSAPMNAANYSAPSIGTSYNPSMVGTGFSPGQLTTSYDPQQVSTSFDPGSLNTSYGAAGGVNAQQIGTDFDFDAVNTAFYADPLNPYAQQSLASTSQGGYLGSNPYLDDVYNVASNRMTESFNEATMPSIAAQFGGAGRTGSEAHASAAGRASAELAEGLQGLAGDIYAPAYEAERNRMIQAASSLGQLGLGAGAQSLQAQELASAAERANQAADLQAQGYGLSAAQSNQAADVQAQQASLQAAMQAQQLGANAAIAQQQAALQAQQMGLQGELANQAAGLQAFGLTSAAEQAQQRAALQAQQLGLTAEQANQAAGLQAMNMGMQSQMANQNAAMQAMGYNNATNIANQNAAMQAMGYNAAADQAQQQAALQAANIAQAGQIAGLNTAANVYGMDLQNMQNAAAQGTNAFNAYNTANLGYGNLANQLYLGERGLATDAAQAAAQTGVAGGNLAANLYGTGTGADVTRRSTAIDAGLANTGQQLAAGQSLANTGVASTNALNNIYGTIASEQARAAALAPQSQMMAYNDMNQLMGLGNQIQGWEQAQIDAQLQAQLYNRQAPWNNLMNYANVVYGLPGGYGTSQTEVDTNPVAGAIGGGLAGYGAAGVLGLSNPWTAAATLGGAVLGGLL